MSKKRIVVGIALNFILLMILIRGLINILLVEVEDYLGYILSEITFAQVVAPMLLAIVVFIYLIALFHELISGRETPKFINALRLIVAVGELAIFLINFCIVVPYAGEFSLANNNAYLLLAIPVMTFISFFPTKYEYSSFGLLYGLIGVILYLGAIIALSMMYVINVPYRFLDVYTQEYYKIIINVVIIVAAGSLSTGLLMLIAKPRYKKS